MEGNADAYRPEEGVQSTSMNQNGPASQEQRGVKFNTSSFDSEATTAVPAGEAGGTEAVPRQRTSSRDYSNDPNWDASKVPPSQFQQRKGSVFATPASRDGHVQKNRDADAEFHKKHAKRFSFSKAKEKVQEATGTGGHGHGHGFGSSRRKSTASSGSN